MSATRNGNFILEADWVLAYEQDRMKLLRNGSVRVSGDRIEEVSDGPIRGSEPRIRAPLERVLQPFCMHNL